MTPLSIFYNRETKLLRSGWRALIFAALVNAPYLILSRGGSSGEPAGGAVFDISFGMIMTYVLIILWTVFISWICLHFLERLPLGSLGFNLRPGWIGEIAHGIVVAATMITLIVLIQLIFGAIRVRPNHVWMGGAGIDRGGLLAVAGNVLMALALLILAGAFEEIVYRGYPFQTLLRGTHPAVPVLLFSIIFGFAHWDNPSRTFFSTANTALAGIWLAVAYLKTRRLWFPTALHFTWNWMMGAFFGIPVSGLTIPQKPLLISAGLQPFWLSGGAYGVEGGAAATIVLVLSIIYFLRMKSPSPPPPESE